MPGVLGLCDVRSPCVFTRCTQAAADTMAVSSLEVDLSGVEEGNTLTVKWRGKPVFIRYRTESEIAEADNVVLTELRDPQKDAERVVNPKVCRVGNRGLDCMHRSCDACLAVLALLR